MKKAWVVDDVVPFKEMKSLVQKIVHRRRRRCERRWLKCFFFITYIILIEMSVFA